MVAIVVEHEFDRPMTVADMHSADQAVAWCLKAYSIQPLLHYLARDGSRSICVFEAPDAEAVRSAMRKAAITSQRRVWKATVHPGPRLVDEGADHPTNDSEDAIAVVERSFETPVSFDDIQAIEDESASCLTLHRVTFLTSYFSADRRRMLCLYEAPDVESVRIANRQAGLPFDCIWGTSLVKPAGSND